MITLLIFLGTILVLVGVHEGGHFLAAKLSGVYVKEFAIGFGPKLLSFGKGETKYSIRAIPFGGYVSMAGEQREKEESKIPADRLLYSKPPLIRILISLAGPASNLAMTFIVAVLGLWAFGLPLIQVGDVMPGMPAAGVLEPGDRLLSIVGVPIYNIDGLDRAVQKSKGAPIEIVIQRNNKQQQLTIAPQHNEKEGRYLIGIYPTPLTYTNKLRALDPGSFLFASGLRAQDTVIAVEGTTVKAAIGILTRLDDLLPADQVHVRVLRDGVEKEFVLRSAGLTSEKLLAGATFADLGLTYRCPGFGKGIALGAGEFAGYVRLIGQWIHGVLSGQVAVSKTVSGPIGIAQLLGTGAKQGGSVFLQLFAYFSLSLGLLNLIPFPALDGSRAAFAVYEIVRGRPISPEREGMIHLMGFFILIGLMILITYHDILKLFR